MTLATIIVVKKMIFHKTLLSPNKTTYSFDDFYINDGGRKQYLYIRYPVWFWKQKEQGNIQISLDSKSEINAKILANVAKLGLITQKKIDVCSQKIDDSALFI